MRNTSTARYRAGAFALLLTAALCVLSARPACGGITASGDVHPANPATWTTSTYAYIGNTGIGTLSVTAGSDVSDKYGYIGFGSSSTGAVTVDGPDSTWTNSVSLQVGGSGKGTLNITGGGTVIVYNNTQVRCSDQASGEIHFDNGTLATGGLFASCDDLTGTGTIHARGIVGDLDLVFDTTNKFSQTVPISGNPGQNITLELYVDGSSDLGAGYSGVGTISISAGRVVASANGYLGYKASSRGEITVAGTGAEWNNSGELYVGNFGTGTLEISSCGFVSNNTGLIGGNAGAAGVVRVVGAGSAWYNSGDLGIGVYQGSGQLSITGGAAVSNARGGIGLSGGVGQVTVAGAGSTWTNRSSVLIGGPGSTLTITDMGLVSVAGVLNVDPDATGNSFINMASGGMLALYGDADDSLSQFFGLISGTDAIRYWDDSISNWAPITGATLGADYTLNYLTTGALAGYTVLTVPEPGTMGLLLIGGGLCLLRRRLRS